MTHPNPKKKTTISPIFWLVGSTSCFNPGMGNKIIRTWVAMFKAVDTCSISLMSWHLFKANISVQNADTGWQRKIKVNKDTRR